MQSTRFLRALPVVLSLVAGPAFAQMKSPMGFSAEAPDRDEYHGFNMAMPIANMNKEFILHLEANLGGHATIAIEALSKGPYEEVREKDMEETGETRQSVAKGGAIIFSRYTRPMSMSGFYWGLGAGYRQELVDWKVRPDGSDKNVDYSLLDDQERLDHAAKLSGTTGHMRVGYRYVGQDLPFLGGIYLGLRHFQAGVDDTKPKKEDPDVRLAPLTDREKERLRRNYATRPECGLEVGVRF